VTADLPELVVEDADAWRSWLGRHHADTIGVWLVLAKKGTTKPTRLTYDDALEEALCHGWIDGQLGRRDQMTYRQRFTPRGPRSRWSKRNVALVERLTREGRMHAAGLAAAEQARGDGRWGSAYAGSREIEVPEDLAVALRANPAAQAMFGRLSSRNRYAVLYGSAVPGAPRRVRVAWRSLWRCWRAARRSSQGPSRKTSTPISGVWSGASPRRRAAPAGLPRRSRGRPPGSSPAEVEEQLFDGAVPLTEATVEAKLRHPVVVHEPRVWMGLLALHPQPPQGHPRPPQRSHSQERRPPVGPGGVIVQWRRPGEADCLRGNRRTRRPTRLAGPVGRASRGCRCAPWRGNASCNAARRPRVPSEQASNQPVAADQVVRWALAGVSTPTRAPLGWRRGRTSAVIDCRCRRATSRGSHPPESPHRRPGPRNPGHTPP
jgi:uncharacterized protein YdeI (YjbR/CyaY-like superfamily)